MLDSGRYILLNNEQIQQFSFRRNPIPADEVQQKGAAIAGWADQLSKQLGESSECVARVRAAAGELMALSGTRIELVRL